MVVLKSIYSPNLFYKMKQILNILLILIISSSFPYGIKCQELCVAPAHLVCDYQLPEKLDNHVRSKLQRALTANGIGSEIGASRFAMVPEIIIKDEQSTATIPVYCDVIIDFVVSLKDVFNGKVFASTAYTTEGKGTSKVDAIVKGISHLRLEGDDFEKFCEKAKEKVISYYADNMSSFINKANNCTNGRDYEQALYILSEIPEEVPSYKSKVVPLISDVYTKEIDNKGESILSRAKAVWAQSPNADGATKVAEILQEMPQSCSSSGGAQQLIAQIKKRIQNIDDKNFALKRKQIEFELQERKQAMANAHAERSQCINAARAIGVAWAKKQPKQVTKVYLW